MTKIRLGNDIILRTTVTRLGEAENLDDKQITLRLHSPYESRELMFARTGNVLISAWLGSQQTKTGTYTLTLTLDYGDGSRNTVDCEDFLTLVSRTSQAGLTGEQKLEATLDVNQSTEGVSEDIDLAITAPANGLSAYEIAVKNGFEGTETEWLDSLKGEVGTTLVAPFSGYCEKTNIRSVAEGEEAPLPDFVAYNTPTSTFVGCVKVGSTYVAYADWAGTGQLSPALYGTLTTTGRTPATATLYMDLESETLCYAKTGSTDTTELIPCYSKLTSSDIDSILN